MADRDSSRSRADARGQSAHPNHDGMRIVQISPFSWDAPGGVQVHVRQLALHLGSRGHEVLILAPGEAPHRRSDVRIVGRAVPFRANGSVAPICLSPSSSRVVRLALREFHPDVIHVHEPLNPSTAMLGVLQANAPVVATFHSYVPRGNLQSKAYRAMMRMMRPVWERIDRRIAVSEAARYSVCSRMGDGGVMRSSERRQCPGVRQRGQPASLPPGRRLLFVGRLERRKGFPVAVRAFGRLATRVSRLRLVVVGDGADRDAIDDLPDAARARVDMLGRVSESALPASTAVEHLPRAVDREGEFRHRAHRGHGVGAAGRGQQHSGYREVLRRGREGLLVTPGEADELAEAVRHLLDDPRAGPRVRPAWPAARPALRLEDDRRSARGDLREMTRMPMREHAASRVLAGV